MEYEVFFLADFSDSDEVTFWKFIFTRVNNNDKWIVSDGSNYYWMSQLLQ